MFKLIYILWTPKGQPRQITRELLLDKIQPRLYDAGVKKLTMYIDDEFSNIRSSAPKLYKGPEISAELSLWVDSVELHLEIATILKSGFFQYAAYEVEESIYTEYGGNKHFRKRDWPDGQRSPVLMAVTLMERPKKLSREEWIKRWHGTQSPVSEAMQPRARYIRNLVIKALTPDAPPFEGIVEEAWPTVKHYTNPFLFYGAGQWNIFKLSANMFRMLRSVSAFLEISKIRSSTMSEYILRS
ncbi:MAG: hypothetical protein WC333_03350 [Dehalococcoidia bacterium]|jgi:hypothetical protein